MLSDVCLWCNISSLAESLISRWSQPCLLGHTWQWRPEYTAQKYDWESPKLQNGNRTRLAQNWSSVCATASTSGIGRQDEAPVAADKDFWDPSNKQCKKMLKHSVKADWFRGPPLNIWGGGQGFGDGPNFFCTMIQEIFFFPAAWSSDYLFQFYFGMDLLFLKAIIYFNSWQLQIIYFTIFLLSIIYLKNIPSPPLEIKWWPPLIASSSGLDFSSGWQSDSQWAYWPAKVCWSCQCNWTQTHMFLMCHHLSLDGSDSNKS